MQLKQLLSNELPYEEDWDDGSISNSILESADDSSSTVHSNDTSPATSISTEALDKVLTYVLYVFFLKNKRRFLYK